MNFIAVGLVLKTTRKVMKTAINAPSVKAWNGLTALLTFLLLEIFLSRLKKMINRTCECFIPSVVTFEDREVQR